MLEGPYDLLKFIFSQVSKATDTSAVGGLAIGELFVDSDSLCFKEGMSDKSQPLQRKIDLSSGAKMVLRTSGIDEVMVEVPYHDGGIRDDKEES